MRTINYLGLTYIPYDTCDIEKEAGLKLIKEIEQTGKYASVIYKNRKPEHGRQFIRIYVSYKT